MKDFLIYFASFMGGMLLTVIIYNIYFLFTESENVSQKLSKKERIIKLECDLEHIKKEMSRLDYPVLMSIHQYEYARRMAERKCKK